MFKIHICFYKRINILNDIFYNFLFLIIVKTFYKIIKSLNIITSTYICPDHTVVLLTTYEFTENYFQLILLFTDIFTYIKYLI